MNSKSQGAGGGAIVGLMLSGLYLFYCILTGALSISAFTSMNVMIASLVVGALAFVSMLYSVVVYIAGQWIKS